MPTTISINIEGRSQDYFIDYLSPDALEYWRAWLEQRAYHLFAQSLGTTPLQLVLGHVSLEQTPKVFKIEAACCPDSVVLLLKLFTGKDLLPDDCEQAFIAINPFIRKVEREVSWAEADRIRAANGKAPLSKKVSNG